MDFEVDFKVDFEFGFTSRPMHVRECKTVLDSGFHAVDFRIPVQDSSFFLLELGFRIPIVYGIPDSLSWNPYSTSEISLILDSARKIKLPSPTRGDSRNTHHASEV